MKIIRYFIQHQSDETGMDGFIPLWIPKSANFDPSSAMGMAHDLLEHRLCDKGAYFEEVMAFGRIVALRGIPGHLTRNAYAPEESLGIELAGIWARSQSEDREALPTAPETGDVGSHAERFLRGMMDRFITAAASECGDYEIEDGIDQAHQRSMLSWLRIGYLDALRRYGEQDHGCYDTGESAFRWADDNQKRISRLGEEATGCVMRLCYDTDMQQMRETLIEPDDDYGRFPSWLRERIWQWERT